MNVPWRFPNGRWTRALLVFVLVLILVGGAVQWWLDEALIVRDSSPLGPAPMGGLVGTPGARPARATSTTAQERPSGGDWRTYPKLSRYQQVAGERGEQLVRCTSPEFGREGPIANVMMQEMFSFEAAVRGVTIYRQTIVFPAPLNITKAYVRVDGVGEFEVLWSPGEAGEIVPCTSVRLVGRAMLVAGEIINTGGQPVAHGYLRGCREHTFTDEHGRFELPLWLRAEEEPCTLQAMYWTGDGRSPKVTMLADAPNTPLRFVVEGPPPVWRPPEGLTLEEACAAFAEKRTEMLLDLGSTPTLANKLAFQTYLSAAPDCSGAGGTDTGL